MVCICFGSKSKNNNSLNPNLSNALQSFRTQEFSKFHGKARWYFFFISFLVYSVKSNSIFNKYEYFVLRFGKLYDICGRIQIIDISSSKLVLYNLIPINLCRFCTIAATSNEVNLTLVFIFSIVL